MFATFFPWQCGQWSQAHNILFFAMKHVFQVVTHYDPGFKCLKMLQEGLSFYFSMYKETHYLPKHKKVSYIYGIQ
jgi:hypothetical protein